ncbi:hypothetical protein ACHAXT_003973 [Thalassiosira profunda]
MKLKLSTKLLGRRGRSDPPQLDATYHGSAALARFRSDRAGLPASSKIPSVTYHGRTLLHDTAPSSAASYSGEGGSDGGYEDSDPPPPPRQRRSTLETAESFRPRRIPALLRENLSSEASFLPAPPGQPAGAGYDDFVAFVTENRAAAADEAPPDENFREAASKRLSRNANAARATGGCPFKHGTVYAGPYPGYVHGNPNRGICPAGCRPKNNDEITAVETPQDTLLREALEYCELYYHERQESMQVVAGLKGSDFLPKEERMAQIRRSIELSGTYEHTFDELQHGARVAWRNAPKCANRKYWGQLKLLDCRDEKTNRGMFDACIRHLDKAMSCSVSEAYITVFKPAPPGEEKDGPRIWNDQLLQFASYSDEEGKVIGDPKNLRFTEMLKQRFGWEGPPDGKHGAYDYLPLVIQADPDGPPELFEVPLECAPPVHIHHPRYPELSSLGMRWYPIPAVCALDMTVGGLAYTAVPFNGWYASTEVLRDLTDESRYNMLKPVGTALGMDTDTKPGDAPLWIDDVMAIVNRAVYHSFKASKIAMVDHHTLINSFWGWYHDEMKVRKYCPVNWKWVVPPMSSSTSPCYLGLSKAQEFTLKPAYIVGKGFLSLETSHFGTRDRSKAVDMFVRSAYLAVFFKRMISRVRGRKELVLIVYSSVTGNAAKWASDLGGILRASCNITFFDACGVNAARDANILDLIEQSALTIFVTSTQGNGELPSLASKFFSFLFDENSHVLAGKQTACLGFGSSAYPIFNGAIDLLKKRLKKSKAKELIPSGKCDAVKGEASVFYEWAANLVKVLASQPSASPFMIKLAEKMKDSNETSALVKRRNLANSLSVEVFSSAEVESAAAMSFMARRGAARRRSSRESQEGVGETPRVQRLHEIMSSSSSVVPEGENEAVARKTSLVKIDLSACGDPPYQPGDHIQVVPRNVISNAELEAFVSNLSGDVSIDSHIYVELKSETISSSELAVSLPLLEWCLGQIIPLDYLLETLCATLAPVSMQACLELSALTSGKDKAVLRGLGQDANEYEKMTSLTGLKWIDVFRTFPSLSKRVSVGFLMCQMKLNHLRSYSISSCKAVVGSELHITVGRLLYSRGGSKKEAGICSSYLTSVKPGEKILFKLNSAPSFHHPLDPSCPIVFICTGTGFAPIRALLQKRLHLLSRGEKLGHAFLVFGQRSSAEGLFAAEVEKFLDEGVLAATFVSYSREPGVPKEYVTDKLLSKRVSRLLSPLLQKSNAHVFICGSANMAEESKRVLGAISTRGCIDEMVSEGRLHCDVFGALSKTSAAKRQTWFHNDRRERGASADGIGEMADDVLADLGDVGLDSESDHLDGSVASRSSSSRSRRAVLNDYGQSQSDWRLLGDEEPRTSFVEELLDLSNR